MSSYIFRDEQRFRLSVPIRFLGPGVAGEGILHDLSLSGGRIAGDAPVSVGTSLVVRFWLQGDAEPFELDEVEVQWVNGFEFGVAFTRLPDVAVERLNRAIIELVQHHLGSK